jgi:hypothetical protein
MPYISSEQRPELEPGLRILTNDLVAGIFLPAKLNYVVCRLLNAYMETHGVSYATIDHIQGVMIGALDEFNERVARPYEAQKIEDNGTVWTCVEPKTTEALTQTQVDELMIHDDAGNHWMKCPDEPDCDLQVTGKGRVYCSHCDPEANQ